MTTDDPNGRAWREEASPEDQRRVNEYVRFLNDHWGAPIYEVPPRSEKLYRLLADVRAEEQRRGEVFFDAWLNRLAAPARPYQERSGDWVTTLSAEPWWPHDPHPDDVRETDFAAIALVMRWGGHMRYAPGHPRAGKLAPYSTGQHSCLVYELVTELGGSVLERACALYHDLHEIVPPGDILTPVVRGNVLPAEHLKRMSRMAAICFRRKLGLPDDLPPIVKKADTILLVTERRDISAWPKGEHGREPPKGVEPLHRIIEAWDPDHTEDAFMRRHRTIQAELRTLAQEGGARG